MLVQCLKLHSSQAAGAEQQQLHARSSGGWHGPLSKQGRAKCFWKQRALKILGTDQRNLGPKSHSRGKFSIYHMDFQQSIWKRALFAVEWLWPRRGTPPAAADSERHWAHISLPAGAGPETLRACLLQVRLCCRRKLHWEYSYWSKFSHNIFFSHPVFTFAEKCFIFDENWRFPYYHMLPFFIKQTHSSHSLDPLKKSPGLFIVAPNLSHPLVSWIHGNLCPSSNVQKNLTPIPQHSGLLTHWTTRDWNLLDGWGGTIKEVFYATEPHQAKGEQPIFRRLTFTQLWHWAGNAQRTLNENCRIPGERWSLWLKHMQETAKPFRFQQINFTPKAWKVFLRICPACLGSTSI